MLYKWAEPEIVLQFCVIFALRCNISSSLVKQVKGIVFHVHTVTMAVDRGSLKVGKETHDISSSIIQTFFPKVTK